MKVKPLKEDDIQKAFVKWMREEHPDIMFCHVANEGNFTPQHRAKLKAMGIRPGWPDITAYPNGKECFIEFKTKTGRLSKAQKDFRGWALDNDKDYIVARSVKEAKDFIEGLL